MDSRWSSPDPCAGKSESDPRTIDSSALFVVAPADTVGLTRKGMWTAIREGCQHRFCIERALSRVLGMLKLRAERGQIPHSRLFEHALV